MAISPSVPNTPQQLLDMNVSSWEDSVCEQVIDHSPVEVMSLMVRLAGMVETYCDNTCDENNFRYNLITMGELSVVKRIMKNLVNEISIEEQ